MQYERAFIRSAQSAMSEWTNSEGHIHWCLLVLQLMLPVTNLTAFYSLKTLNDWKKKKPLL